MLYWLNSVEDFMNCIIILFSDINIGREKHFFKAGDADDRDGWIQALRDASKVVVSKGYEILAITIISRGLGRNFSRGGRFKCYFS